ncbi:MAG: HAMP domain-containing protein [Bacteriovoracaceae bacterium]
MARSLTKPIELLFEGTSEVAKGNFEHVTEVNSSDELGVLSDSFNFMNKEIIRYMQEVKEKARMENELAAANLVQSSFFPETEKNLVRSLLLVFINLHQSVVATG